MKRRKWEDAGKEELLLVLIRHYREIRQSCSEEILERMKEGREYYESFEWFERLMCGRDPDAWTEILQDTSDRTEEIICVIDDAVSGLGRQVRKSGDLKEWRAYDALYSRYFSRSEMTVKDISRKYGVKKSVIYDDLRLAETQILAILSDISEHYAKNSG